ncbi:MAG: carboxypeptidase regulatory-like domain-containing protein [Kofleriaceae bacterium]|nr:carboxypeptidase regulatory-like domain-containing protein [Kofleriaceae bacterium]
MIALGAPAPLPVDPAYQATLVTDADGGFRVTGLAAGTWWIVAAAPGMAEGKSARIPLDAGKVVQGVEIVLSPGTFVVGTVTSTRGPPVVGATVSARPRDDGGGAGAAADRAGRDRDRLIAITDGDGAYRLGPLVGDVDLEVTAWGFGDGHASLSLPAPAGDQPAEQVQDVALAPADATLRGRVVDGDQLPVRGAAVVVAAGAARGRRAVTDDTGWFSIGQVPEGPAELQVDHPDFPAQTATITTEADGAVTLAWGGAVDGRLFDHHTGAPLPGVAVVLTGPGGRIEVATGADGALHVGPLIAGTWTVRVAVAGYLPVERAVEVTAGREVGAVTVRDLRLEVERGALLAGVVYDRHGERVAGATITVARGGDEPLSVEARTDAEGEFRIRDAPTGDVEVTGRRDALRGGRAITLRPGDEVLSFQLELQ